MSNSYDLADEPTFWCRTKARADRALAIAAHTVEAVVYGLFVAFVIGLWCYDEMHAPALKPASIAGQSVAGTARNAESQSSLPCSIAERR